MSLHTPIAGALFTSLTPNIHPANMNFFSRCANFLLRPFVHPFYKEDNSQFVALAEDSYKRQPGDARALAFYLPQFHAIPLNDKHFGRNFTEWTNVTKAKPQFIGHNQPQLPIDVGFYDLSHDDVMYRQIELAKQYGVYGFCFHYYWFGKDKRLLEKPIFNWLNNKELNFPFCLCWANENWSTLWDGGKRNIIMEQQMNEHTYAEFLEDILPFLQDERYIRVNGAPLLVIYRPALFTKEQFTFFVDNLQQEAAKNGIPRLHILVSNAFQETEGLPDCEQWHVEGVVEFPPHGIFKCGDRQPSWASCNKNKLRIVDMGNWLKKRCYMKNEMPPTGKLYKGCFPGWDNAARKTYSSGFCFDGCTPDLYTQWLSDCIMWTKTNHPEEEQFVFINAWNEWAEGAHLEPCRKYGYAYLAATRKAIESTRSK